MHQILILICRPDKPVLDDSTLRTLRARLDDLGAESAPPAWLDPTIACEIGFDGIDGEQAVAAARLVLGERPVDVAAMTTEHRRKALLVADMESTIIENEMLDELAEFLGLRAHIAAITARAMNGEIDFAAALKERVLLLKDMEQAKLDHAATLIRIMPGAQTLIATMRANGAYCALVSGGFTVFTDAIHKQLGFDSHHANSLLLENGKLTGTVGEPILGKEAKLEMLLKLAGERHLKLAQTIAVGDGANDLPMLQAAGLGVAYRAKPSVAAACRVRIDHGDLTALLYLQGYRRDEFVGQ
ncbi:MAG: phosphoserine phosphatase SerB [Rhodospirillales bacterium]